MAETAWPRSWDGHWIAPEPVPDLGPAIAFGGEIPPHAFSRVMYRKVVALASVPSSAPVRLTADSRYLLLVNGVEVGRGPVRSQPRRLGYDSYDLAPHLVPGDNALAVLVTYYGRANAFWQPAATNGGLGTDALLVLEADLGGPAVVSDDSWRVHRSPAWSEFGRESVDGVPVERLDARELAPDWATAAFDDSGWAPATIVRTTHIGGFARSQPPTDPYGALLPRPIGPLGGPLVEPAAVLDSSTRQRPTSWTGEQPAVRVLDVLAAMPTAMPTATGDGSLPATFGVGPGLAQHLAVDFGRVVAGFVEVDLAAPAGAVVELHYRERAWAPDVEEGFSSPRAGAQYVARGADDAFRALELNGLRYLHLVVHADEPGEATVTAVRVREHTYPQTGDAFFRCDDPQITALYDAGVRTVQLNAFDAFTDCPTREQRAWVGDGVVHQMVHLATNEDWRLARQYVHLGASPRPDGILPMSVVGEVEWGASVTIPDWSLHWVHGLFQLYRYAADLDEVLALLPVAERVLRWYLPYVDARGTISDVPEWNLVDWSSVFTTGRSSLLTGLWARGLREVAEMSDAVGNAGTAAWARGLWEQARVGYEDFWDPDRGCYVDQIVDGRPNPAASQPAGAVAIVSGLAPEERWGRVLDRITDPDRLVVRSWIGGIDGGYDLQKMIDQSRGVQRPDWETAEQVVIAEPFFSYVVHDAVAAAGRAGELVDLMRRWSQFLVDGYDTLGECWGWGTPVHGWSSTPTRDLVRYVLGVTPAEPGFARVRVSPAPGPLRDLEGAVPTPYGLVRVSVRDGVVAVDSPVPVVLVAGAGVEDLPAGRHERPLAD